MAVTATSSMSGTGKNCGEYSYFLFQNNMWGADWSGQIFITSVSATASNKIGRHPFPSPMAVSMIPRIRLSNRFCERYLLRELRVKSESEPIEAEKDAPNVKVE